MPFFQKENRIGIIPFSDDLKDEWDRVVNNSGQAWMCHEFCEHDILKEAWGPEVHSFLVSLNGDIVGIFPMQRHMGNPALLDSQIMGSGGLAVSDEVDPVTKTEICDHVYRHLTSKLGKKFAAVKVTIPPQVTYTKNELPYKFFSRDISTQTYIVDLGKTEDELFMAFSKKSRWCVRKAMRDYDFDIYMASTLGDIYDYYKLHVETYTRTGVNPHPRAYFEGRWNHLGSRGMCVSFMAKLDGELIAADNMAMYKGWALYWSGASLDKALDTNVNRVLQWEAIKWARKCGCAVYECGEAFPDAEKDSKLWGLTRFKRSFGGTLAPFRKGLIA